MSIGLTGLPGNFRVSADDDGHATVEVTCVVDDEASDVYKAKYGASAMQQYTSRRLTYCMWAMHPCRPDATQCTDCTVSPSVQVDVVLFVLHDYLSQLTQYYSCKFMIS